MAHPQHVPIARSDDAHLCGCGRPDLADDPHRHPRDAGCTLWRHLSTAATPTARVLEEVRDERDRQDAKWGEQNHPDGTGSREAPLAPLCWADDRANHLPRHTSAPVLAGLARDACQARAAADLVSWRDILLEEVFEALAEDSPARLRTELVQVAAVAVQWVGAIDRRQEAPRG